MDVIAERRLWLKNTPRPGIRIVIFKPVPDGPEDYRCPYQIEGIGDEKVRYAVGVDAVQALELVIKVLPAELEALRQEHSDLRWANADEGDFGFESTR